MKKFCVIGNPISHSLSPVIFKYLFNFFNINATYDSVLIEDDKALVNFFKDNISLYSGYNITSPYKKIAFNSVNELAISIPPIKSSKRSTSSSLFLCVFAKGEISLGKLIINVGSIKFGSTK